jgi:toxin ParE1/3/4
MIFEIKITEQADSDLRGIFEYIAFELQAPGNAMAQLNRLETSIMKLDEFPKRYCSYQKEPWKSRGIHVMTVDNYAVFYIPDDENQVVMVIRVVYGGCDIDARLNNTQME